MDIQVGNPNSVWLMVLVVGGLVLAVYSTVARYRAAQRFASEPIRQSLIPSWTAARFWQSVVLLLACMGLLVLALMDIRWGKTSREVPQKGIEVMFVLDVSRSMLAEDAAPNRLDRAKEQIKDMVDVMAGDRVGLVVFAGDARLSVPLTSHYADFKETLDSVGPHSVRVGGSRLGNALELAASGFLSKTNDHKAIVVFTDGEDQESQPVAIAKHMYDEAGVRVFTVGLGDMDRGARIPDRESKSGSYIVHNGQQVWSKMNGQILSQIATETNGAYIPAGVKRVNMADVYHGYVANVPQTEFETAKIDAFVPRFQWFAIPALALLLVEVLLTTRRPPRQRKGAGGQPENVSADWASRPTKSGSPRRAA